LHLHTVLRSVFDMSFQAICGQPRKVTTIYRYRVGDYVSELGHVLEPPRLGFSGRLVVEKVASCVNTTPYNVTETIISVRQWWEV
jgi:hypothetical protein